jgi:hypothetical protein
MNPVWQYEILSLINLAVTILGLYFLSRIFGSHFLKDLIRGSRKEFRTRMGVLSFVCILTFLYFIFEPATFRNIALLATPKSMQGEFDTIAPHIDHTLIWALVVSLFGDLLLIAWMTSRDPPPLNKKS